MAEEWFTLGECAKVLGCTRIWVWKLVKAGKLLATKVGKRWQVKPHHLRQFVESQAIEDARKAK